MKAPNPKKIIEDVIRELRRAGRAGPEEFEDAVRTLKRSEEFEDLMQELERRGELEDVKQELERQAQVHAAMAQMMKDANAGPTDTAGEILSEENWKRLRSMYGSPYQRKTSH